MYEGFALRRELRDENLKLARMERIEQLETEVFEAAAGVANAVLDFREVTPEQRDPPPAWIERYGEEGARQRLAVAKSGWLPASVAPVAVSHAIKMMTGISRGRQHRLAKLTQNNVNVKISLPAPTSREHPGPITYETRDLDE